jgi:hypothetical protein
MRNNEPTSAEPRFQHITATVKASGVKLTAQRLEIFRELAATADHPDAETLFRAVQARLPTVSLDTVYRTLWMLHDLGLVSTLGPRRDPQRSLPCQQPFFRVKGELHSLDAQGRVLPQTGANIGEL